MFTLSIALLLAAQPVQAHACPSPVDMDRQLDTNLLSAGLRPGLSRDQADHALGQELADLGWVDAGYRVVQWVIRVDSGSRTVGAVVEGHFSKDGQAEAWESAGRFHVQRITEQQLDALEDGARLPAVISRLCAPEELIYLPDSGGLLLHYTIPRERRADEFGKVFVELQFDDHARLTRKSASLK
jgi:hypothetical protein